MDDLRKVISNKSGGRGGRMIVSAGGQVFVGPVADAAQLGEDYFTLDTINKKDVPHAEGNGFMKVNIPYAAVSWWVDL
jgi:hypothetical protein